MKALVVFKKGERPRYVTDFGEPVVQNEQETLMTVKAAAIKHLDRMRASGTHYSTQGEKDEPKVPGGDGVGLLEDGTRVYALGVSGMIAEKATVEKFSLVKLPDSIDDATAAALPNAVMGSVLALRFRAQMQPGETVLINGATGVTGKIAVQIAKHYGAKRIIATGRNEEALQSLLALGADEVISLKQADAAFIAQIKAIHQSTPIDVIIDYLWGNTAEMLLSCLKGNGGFSHRTRYVTVGAMAGDKVALSSSILRSTDVQLSGSGLGSWSKQEVQQLITEILPEMFNLAAQQKLVIDTVQVPLEEIETAWHLDIPSAKRLVVVI